MTQNEVIEISRNYVLWYRSEGISVDKAFLYGIYLTNTAISESDIDLMIVTENANDDYLAGKIWNLTKKVNSRIEPFLIATKRFYSGQFSFG